jgi:LysM repeat protein
MTPSAPTPAPQAKQVTPAAKAPAPAVSTPAAAAVPTTPEPSAPSPELTTLVPVTPPAVPAPKPVIARRPATLPAVSAPAPQSKPSEAPVTETANVGASAALATTPAVESSVRPDGKPVKIQVKKDETLESIAKRFGTTKVALMMENNLVTEKIHPGQELKIPNHR